MMKNSRYPLIKAGYMVYSKQGRDQNCFYIIVEADAKYVYLADGRKYTVNRPKKKNPKHVQIMYVREEPVSSFDDETIRDFISQHIRKGMKEEY